jgi:hypothetical protein
MKTRAGGRNQSYRREVRYAVTDIDEDEHTVVIANGDLGQPLSEKRIMGNDQGVW